MTHEELLAKITGTRYTENGYTISDGTYGNERLQQALRAVMEIIKGYDDGQVRVNEEFNQGVLSLSNVIKEAIEKELQ